MNNELLKKIGLGEMDISYLFIGVIVIAIISLIVALAAVSKMKKIQKEYTEFMKGNNGKSLEEAVKTRFKQVDDLIEENKKNTQEITDLFENMNIAIQKVGIVKYDAFSEMGGKLSFALVMLDKNNDGFVINAMHSREGCYTYIKEIIKGESYIPLGTEEKKALDKAMDNFVE